MGNLKEYITERYITKFHSNDVVKYCLTAVFTDYNKMAKSDDPFIEAFKEAVDKIFSYYNIKDIGKPIIISAHKSTNDYVLYLFEQNKFNTQGIKTIVATDGKHDKIWKKYFKDVKIFFESYPEYAEEYDNDSTLFASPKAIGFETDITVRDVNNKEAPYAGSYSLYFEIL
jgi:hypothetical protein